MDCLKGVRRALLTLAILPVLVASGVLPFTFWPWITVFQHLLLLGLVGSLLVDLSLAGFRKIPFTCSWLPGKSKLHMVFWFGVIPTVAGIHKTAKLELSALADPVKYAALIAVLAGAAAAARRIANSSATRGNPEVQFKETASSELVRLDLEV